MSYVFYERSDKPAYLQLYELLKKDIVEGLYSYGSRMPSKRIMAYESGVSVITVEHAYALLCDEGYIDARERSGYFVVFRYEEGFAASADSRFSGRQGGSAHESREAFPFSVLAKTMRRVISDYAGIILDKAPNSGCIEFREALRQYLGRNRGIHADVEQIIIGSGAEYLYGRIVELLGRGKVYALESPSYEQIENVYRASGARVDMLPLGTDGIDSTALNNTGADVLHVSPFRSFPTGITATASKRYEYIRWARKTGRFIIEDDFESEFTILSKPEETLFALSDNDNVIYLNTFTKTISPSLRVGYMVLPKKLVKPFGERLGFYSCTVPSFEQYVLAELISDGDFERHINRVRRAKRSISSV